MLLRRSNGRWFVGMKIMQRKDVFIDERNDDISLLCACRHERTHRVGWRKRTERRVLMQCSFWNTILLIVYSFFFLVCVVSGYDIQINKYSYAFVVPSHSRTRHWQFSDHIGLYGLCSVVYASVLAASINRHFQLEKIEIITHLWRKKYVNVVRRGGNRNHDGQIDVWFGTNEKRNSFGVDIMWRQFTATSTLQRLWIIDGL